MVISDPRDFSCLPKQSGSIYECVVVDNTTFWKNGKIKIRICRDSNNEPQFNDFSVKPEKSRNYNKIDFREDTEDINMEGADVIDNDEYAELSTCIGGAYDSGIFYLPQPNTHGLVAKILCGGSSYQRYVWIGALITTTPSLNGVLKPTDSTEYITQINIPRDNDHGFYGGSDETSGTDNEFNNDYYYSEYENGYNDKKSNMFNKQNQNHAIVFKQKETYWSKDENGVAQGTIDNEEDSKISLDWKKAKTFNFGVLDKDKVVINHQIYDEDGNRVGYGNFIISNDNGITAEFSKTDSEDGKTISSKIIADANGTASISSNYKDEITNEFSATQNQLTISHNNTTDKISSSIIMEKSETSGNTTMTLSLTGNSKEQTIRLKTGSDSSGIDIETSGDISLSPGKSGKIYLGGGSGTNYLLSYPSNMTSSNIETASIVPVKNILV